MHKNCFKQKNRTDLQFDYTKKLISDFEVYLSYLIY